MHISRVVIKNFRNFKHLDVDLGQNVVIFGENGVGKTNFLEALRLVLDPARERRLFKEDFHRPGVAFKGTIIEVHIYLSDVEDSKLKTVLTDCLVQDDPVVYQISYRFHPKDNKDPDDADRREDYKATIYGKGNPTNKVRSQVHKHFNLRVIPALRDIGRDISVWRNSPLRRLVELMDLSDHPDFLGVVKKVRSATKDLQEIPPIESLKKDIKERLIDMVEGVYGLDPQIGMLSSNPEEIQRALRLFIDENLSLKRSSLGLANVLYLTLLMLEIEQREKQEAEDEDEGEKYQFTVLAVEEPEAHLHPHLQRLVFGDFLRRRPPILLSTHSPQIISVAEADTLMLLKESDDSQGTEATSTAGLSRLPDWKPDWDSVKHDLERYLDATRGEVVFAKGVILVEGDAEIFLVPAFANQMKEAGMIPYTLDGAGVSVCSVAGTDFVPYVRFLGPAGLDLPVVVITDGDKHIGVTGATDDLLDRGDIEPDVKDRLAELKESGDLNELRAQLEDYDCGLYEGLARGIRLLDLFSPKVERFVVQANIPPKPYSGRFTPFIPGLEGQYKRGKWENIRSVLGKFGIFVNDWTLEAELIAERYGNELVKVYGELGASVTKQENMRDLLDNPTSVDICKFMNRVEESGKGKGRFAQRLASKVDADRVPSYIESAIERVVTEVISHSDLPADA